MYIYILTHETMLYNHVFEFHSGLPFNSTVI